MEAVITAQQTGFSILGCSDIKIITNGSRLYDQKHISSLGQFLPDHLSTFCLTALVISLHYCVCVCIQRVQKVFPLLTIIGCSNRNILQSFFPFLHIFR